MKCSVKGTLVMALRPSGLARPAGLEHLQHPVGDDEAADDVARRGNDGDGSKYRGKSRFVLARDHDRADHRDGIQCIGERHERRVQQRRNPANHVKADEAGQNEDKQAVQPSSRHVSSAPAAGSGANELRTHLLCPASAGKAKNSRTRSFTISPSRVSSVSRMISSPESRRALPSFSKCSRNDVTLRAYIWLAW